MRIAERGRDGPWALALNDLTKWNEKRDKKFPGYSSGKVTKDSIWVKGIDTSKCADEDLGPLVERKTVMRALSTLSFMGSPYGIPVSTTLTFSETEIEEEEERMKKTLDKELKKAVSLSREQSSYAKVTLSVNEHIDEKFLDMCIRAIEPLWTK